MKSGVLCPPESVSASILKECDLRENDMFLAPSASITFVIFTYNEAERIGRVIENFKKFGKLLIVDNFSTDDTVKIAQGEGCDVLMNKNSGWCEDIITTSRVKDVVKSEWIYWGYADELVDEASLKQIMFHIKSPEFDILNINRKNYYYGRFMHDAYSDRMNRVFKKTAIDFTGNTIHSFGRPTVPPNRIKVLPKNVFVHHFISNTAKIYVNTIDRYTDIEADKSHNESDFLVILKSLKRSFGNYIFRGAYKAGFPGLYICILMFFYPLIAMMKRYEKRLGLDRSEIERLNNVMRDSLIEKLRNPE